MKDFFTQSMAWLHTWGGLVPGWVLFVIFFAGTLTCFDKEISHWMRPATHAASSAGQFSYDRSIQHLQAIAPDAHSWWLRGGKEREPLPVIGWVNEDQPYEYRLLEADGGKLLGNNTEGGEFFFKLHYRLGITSSLGIWLVGIAGMFMLVALVTGIIIHKRIFKDFFTFRPRGGRGRAWLDAHNASSVLALPFHLIITYTGLTIFSLTYFPAGIQSAFDGDLQKFAREADSSFERGASGESAALHAVDPLVARAEALWGGSHEALWVNVEHPGDRNAVIAVMSRQPKDEIAWMTETVYFDGVSGEVLHRSGPMIIGHHIEHFLSGLHFAQYGGPSIRWLYFFMGLTGCLMIASGMVYWVEKRRQRHLAIGPQRGFRLVCGLNAAAIAGLPAAAAAYFLANRLLPGAATGHAGYEQMVFYGIWLLMLAHALVGAKSPRLWQVQLYGAAILWLAIPVVNLLTTSRSHLVATLPSGDWTLATVDLMALLAGTVLGYAAHRQGSGKRDRRNEDAASGETASALHAREQPAET